MCDVFDANWIKSCISNFTSLVISKLQHFHYKDIRMATIQGHYFFCCLWWKFATWHQENNLVQFIQNILGEKLQKLLNFKIKILFWHNWTIPSWRSPKYSILNFIFSPSLTCSQFWLIPSCGWLPNVGYVTILKRRGKKKPSWSWMKNYMYEGNSLTPHIILVYNCSKFSYLYQRVSPTSSFPSFFNS